MAILDLRDVDLQVDVLMLNVAYVLTNSKQFSF
jgi:hypothetical protein